MHLYRYNPSNKVCSNGDLTCIFNPLTMRRRYLTRNDFDESQINLDSPSESDFEEYSRSRRLADKSSIAVMYLVLGSQCNFRCRYCFVNPNGESLSWQTIEDGVSLLMSQPGSVKHIRFYGGEPLLHFDAIEKLILLNKRRGFEVSYAIPTNGSLITSKICKVVKENGVSMMISLDGPRTTNDEMRIDTRGQGTFCKVECGIRLLHEHDIPFQIACTIHNHNIENLSEIIAYLYDEFEPVSVNLNLPYSITPAELKMTIDEYIENVVHGMRKCLDQGTVPGDFFEDKVRPFLNMNPPEIFCGGCGGHFVLAPPDRIGPCIAAMDDQSSWTDMNSAMNNSNIFGTGIFAEWANRHVVDLVGCSDCPAISLCNGGCPYNALVSEGSIWQRDRLDCLLTRKTLDLLLEVEAEEEMKSRRWAQS